METTKRIKRHWVAVICMISATIAFVSCQRGDLKVTPIIEGQLAPHAGFNFGPDSYLKEGQPANVTGIVIYIKGADPNEIFGQ